MATVAETLAYLAQINALFVATIPQAQALIAQQEAINPAQSDAALILAGLEQQYVTLRTSYNNEAGPLFKQYSDAFDSLTEAEKKEANKSPITKEFLDLATQAKATSKKHKDRLMKSQSKHQLLFRHRHIVN